MATTWHMGVEYSYCAIGTRVLYCCWQHRDESAPHTGAARTARAATDNYRSQRYKYRYTLRPNLWFAYIQTDTVSR